MIIPIRCFTCGKVLADKWEHYKAEVDKIEKAADKEEVPDHTGGAKPKRDTKFEKHRTQQLLDELGLERMCCRRHMLGHVDLIHLI